MSVTDSQAAAWAELARRNLAQEFPYSSHHMVSGPDESSRPSVLHPSFHGSFDWHSAVHMHWLLVSLLSSHRSAIDADPVIELLTTNLSPERLAAEAEYLAAHPSYERPYGWAWLLALHAAALRSPEPAAARWATALEPSTAVVAKLIQGWLNSALPIRYGMHQNSAFGCLVIRAVATDVGHPELVPTVEEAARRWFGDDHDAPWHTEPSAHDFLSPGLTEAALMQTVLGPDFGSWWAAFNTDPSALGQLRPAAVADPSDGQQAHLYGLGLSRAWSLAAIIEGVAEEDTVELRRLAEENLDYGLAATGAEGEFMSDHWLASFAYLALQRPF